MKNLMILALAFTTTTALAGGGGGGQSSGPRCTSVTTIVDSKTVKIRDQAGSVKLELEKTLRQCEGLDANLAKSLHCFGSRRRIVELGKQE